MAQLQRWTLRAGLFLLPLAYLPNAYDRWVLPKLVLGRLLIVALAVLLGLRALRDGQLVIKRSPVELPLQAFVASGVLSTLFAVNVNVAIFGTYSRYDGVLTLATYAVLFWLALQTIDGPDDAWALLRTLLVSAYVVAAVAIAQSVAQSLAPNPGLVWADAVRGSIVRAYGSLGQWEVLGEFLVLAWPIAIWEAAKARSTVGRALAINAVAVIGLALVLTFSRSAWAAALVATAVVLVAARPWICSRSLLVTLGVVVAIGVGVVGLTLAGGSDFENTLAQRANTVLHPAQWDVRPAIWRDSLRLIASRPIVGYGPDTFGMVFPMFDSVGYSQPIDKAHAELLQIASTQGLIGVAAYLWLLAAFGLAFRHDRAHRETFALLAGLVAYEAMLQVNFTAIGSALPFWIFAAAAMHSFRAVQTASPLRITVPKTAVLRWGAVALSSAAVVTVVIVPVIADLSLMAAVDADYVGDGGGAKTAAERAHDLAPEESVYTVEVANIAFERNDWKDARALYTRASQLGTFNPMVYRNLAVADRALGLMDEAHAAARAAYELNRYDPVNQALLAQFEQARNRIHHKDDSLA